MPLPLPREEVHLWYLLPEEAAGAELLERYRALITPEETARTARYHFERHQVEHLLTRALARTVLSRYTGVDPEQLRFSLTEHGRPELASSAASGLVFNLSNTEGLIACCVARDREVGVDVESLERPGETIEIADRFFSPLEVAELRALPAARQRERFFDYWTLKESYIKARGLGLGLPLDRFSFFLEDPIRIEIEPELHDRAERWWFEQVDLSPLHKTAVAATKEPHETVRLVIHRTVPLLEPT